MYMFAQIKEYKATREGTYLMVLVKDRNITDSIVSKKIHSCNLWLEDGRYISAEQRKKAYATIADISNYTGYPPEEQKEWLKYLHIFRTGSRYFSLSSCTMETAREFITTIIDYALEMGIALNDLAINRTDDIDNYLYSCLKHKRCAVCGRDGELHHEDTIGMGNNRKKVEDSAYRKLCLCRSHHTEAHTTGTSAFYERYKVYGIKYVTSP